MANEKNTPSGSGKPETKETQTGTSTGLGKQNIGNERDQSRSQSTGHITSKTPEAERTNNADRDRTSAKEGAGSRDGGTGGNPAGMHKDNATDARAQRTSGDMQRDGDRSGVDQRDVSEGSGNDGAEGTEDPMNENDTDSEEATDDSRSKSDRGSDSAGGM